MLRRLILMLRAHAALLIGRLMMPFTLMLRARYALRYGTGFLPRDSAIAQHALMLLPPARCAAMRALIRGRC